MMFLWWITYFSISITVVYGNFARKIYGGKDVHIDKFPFQVSVQIRNYHICGGAIISNNHVLTAANCVLAERDVVYGNIQVLSGTRDIMYEPSTHDKKIIQVSHVIFHMMYDPLNNWINDIAILKLESPMTFTRALREPARVPPRNTLGRIYHVTGWGVDPVTLDLSRYLQRFEVNSIHPGICKLRYYKETDLSSTQYCFIPTLPTSGVSQGAGGSPVMYGRQILGVISLDSLDVNQPAIYTDAFGHKSWIEKMTARIII
ncbi:ovochymase-2-like [Aphidius gifuensis]|uniref:ovochymase-2-like n=1 Tax=Aphidius gifuensis TaxID=684658 RepID=UPI001CDB9F68|nr:ovochymase-2-like [Aphidius gifuensis]